jgi:hypothetical protein
MPIRNDEYLGAFAERIAEARNVQIAVKFDYGLGIGWQIDPPTLTGDGLVEHIPARSTARIASTTGTAYLETAQRFRYKPSQSGYAWCTASFAGQGEGEVVFGDRQNGIGLRMAGGVLSAYIRRDGTLTHQTTGDLRDRHPPAGPVASCNFSGLNIFFFDMGYLGIYPPTIQMLGTDGRMHTLHQFATSGGALQGSHLASPLLPVSYWTSGAMSLEVASIGAGTMGNNGGINNRGYTWPSSPIINGTAPEGGQFTLAANTNVQTVAIMRSMPTLEGRTNHVRSRLADFRLDAGPSPGNTDIGVVYLQILPITDPATQLTGTLDDWQRISDSVIEYHAGVTYNSGTVTLDPVISLHQHYTGTKSGAPSAAASALDPLKFRRLAKPGQMFAVVAKTRGGHAVPIRWEISWEDLM